MKQFQKVTIITLLLILGCEQLIQPIRVGAIEDRLRQFYTTNEITTFDPNDCALPGNENTGAVDLKGDTTIEKILSFFMSQENGLTLAQAAGIVGNMAQESPHGVDSKTGVNLPNPAIEQGGAIVGPDYVPKNGKGFGLVQWTWKSRQQPLVDLVSENGSMKGKKITDLDVQLTYVWQELNGDYSHTLEELRRSKHPVEAAIIVHGPPWPGYEASADSPEDVRKVRGGNAEKIYNYYKDAPPLNTPEDPEDKNKGHGRLNEDTQGSLSRKPVKYCDQSFSGGNLNETLLGYAWPNYRGLTIEATEPYKTAVQKAMSDGRYVGGTNYRGIDCGGFVTLLLVDSGFESSYNYESKLTKGAGNTTAQKQWLDANWYHLSPGEASDAGNRQPGDVAINSTHTYVYVGEVEGFESVIASASWDERAPMAGKEGVVDNSFQWYRKDSPNKEIGPNMRGDKRL